MSALIYKVASYVFTFWILCKVLRLVFGSAKQAWVCYSNYKTLKKKNDPRLVLQEKNRRNREFEEMMAREKNHRQLVAELHYEYKGFINLSRVESDRKKLFEDQWTTWKHSKNGDELLSCPGDYQARCINMFGEMSLARKSIIANKPEFWTAEKEGFWRKICHPAVKKSDVRGKSSFETRQRILAENEFNSGDDGGRSSA